jgi:hypothetical protein
MWVSMRVDGHSVVNETIGVSRHLDSPSTGGGNEGEAAGVATQIVVMWGWWIRVSVGSAWGWTAIRWSTRHWARLVTQVPLQQGVEIHVRRLGWPPRSS